MKTMRNETKRNEARRDETERDESGRSGTERNDTKPFSERSSRVEFGFGVVQLSFGNPSDLLD
jgi:hypothetical protein